MDDDDNETIYVIHYDLLIIITISSMYMSTAHSTSQPFTTVQRYNLLSSKWTAVHDLCSVTRSSVISRECVWLFIIVYYARNACA